ncbi:MAG: hypothetical protein ACRDFX_12375, partial [Chloroflexota bacterium]
MGAPEAGFGIEGRETACLPSLMRGSSAEALDPVSRTVPKSMGHGWWARVMWQVPQVRNRGTGLMLGEALAEREMEVTRGQRSALGPA